VLHLGMYMQELSGFKLFFTSSRKSGEEFDIEYIF